MDDVTNQHSGPQLFTIGEFARLTRLTTKALRVYEENGLLRPVQVDPANGYRLYGAEQVDTARLVGLLRGADVGLAEIALMLADLPGDRGRAADRLDGHLRAIEQRHSSRRLLVRHIHSIIRDKEPSMFTIDTRYVPAQRIMSMQRRLHAHETDTFVAEVKEVFAAHLGSVAPTGPLTLIFHGVVDAESDGPLEVVLAVPDHVAPTDLIGIRTEPAHDEAFTTITKAEWAYPAILAAYDAVGCSPEARERTGSRLSCREVYLAEPDAIGDDDLVCDVAFPLGDQ